MESECSNAEGNITGDGTNWSRQGEKLIDIKTVVVRSLPLDLGRDAIFDKPSYEVLAVKLFDIKTGKMLVNDYVFCHNIGQPAR